MFVQVDDHDMPAVAALMNLAYRGADGGWATESGYITGDRTSAAMLRADVDSVPDAALLKWVQAAGDGFDGCVWLEPLGGDLWYLGSLTIAPGRQAGGLGRMVLAAAEDWVRVRGGNRVRLTVINVRETLIAWYVRRGYRLTGETKPFPYGDDRFGTPTRDDLRFVVLEKALQAAG